MLITGKPGAATGDAPLTVTMQTSGGQTATTLAAADGSFSFDFNGTPGQTVTLVATDGQGRESAPLLLGTISANRNVDLRLLLGDNKFKPAGLQIDGHRLAVTQDVETHDTSDKLPLFDISNPLEPSLSRVVAATIPVHGAVFAGDRLYGIGQTLMSVSLTDPAEPPLVHQGNYPYYGYGSAFVAGNYLLASDYLPRGYDSSSRIDLFDLARPAAPRNMMGVSTDGYMTLRQIHDYRGFIVAVTHVDVEDHPEFRPGDVVIYRHVANDLPEVNRINIPSFDSWYSQLAGQTLYLTDPSTAELVTVDLSDPLDPTPAIHRYALPAPAAAFAVRGDRIYLPTDSGLLVGDVSSGSFSVIETKPVSGTRLAAALAGGALYLLNGDPLMEIVEVTAPPAVDPGRIQVVAAGAANATITGEAAAVSASSSATIELRNASTGATVTANVAADGSFTATLAAGTLAAIDAFATDALGQHSLTVRAGVVPLGELRELEMSDAAHENRQWFRTLAPAGGTLWASGTYSNLSVPYHVTDLAHPQTGSEVSGDVPAFEMHVRGDVLYSYERYLGAIDVPAGESRTGGRPSAEGTVRPSFVLSGAYAFGTVASGEGSAIETFELTDPRQPVYVATSTIVDDAHVTRLLRLSERYLVALAPEGADVVVIDAINPYALAAVSSLQIPSFHAGSGTIVGTTLYISGIDGGLAIVDVSNALAPQFVSRVATRWRTRTR